MTMASDSDIVIFEGVSKSYDGRSLVVKDLSLTLRRGEFLTLLGPSGSGKTTLLRMLAGFETPSAGEIYLNGTPLSRVPPHRRNIGMVFQSYALFPHMTVADNLAYPLKVRRMPAAERRKRIAWALETVRMQAFGERLPAQLSGGQQQRVAVARALVFEPALVLMDEPLGALDKNLREELQYEIKHLHDRLGLSIVYVTHDQGEALTLSDRVAVFHQGGIAQLGTPRDIYDRPANAFVAAFVGENNALRGTVLEHRNGCCLVRLAGGEILASAPARAFGSGESVLVALRPESARIGNPADGDNAFEGEVLETTFHGDHARTRLSLLGRDDFIIKTPARQAVAEVGQRVVVSWEPQSCRALDA